MTWAPTAIRGPGDAADRRAIIGWREEWTCFTCSSNLLVTDVNVIGPAHQCHSCRGWLAWVCDRSGQVGEWRCPHCRRYAFDDQMFGVARDGSPDGVGERHDLEPLSCLVAVLERWVPPRAVVRIVQNSRLYVPLLLDGAGLLPESAAGGWHSHPLSERWWEGTVGHLRASAAVSAVDFVDSLRSQPADAAHASLHELADAVSRQSGQLTITRAVSLALDARGYIQPLVQDVLLQTFGGLMLSSEIDMLSNGFRGPRAIGLGVGVGGPGCYASGVCRSSTGLIVPHPACSDAPSVLPQPEAHALDVAANLAIRSPSKVDKSTRLSNRRCCPPPTKRSVPTP